MQGYIADIESLTEDNSAFRHVLYTGKHLQLVLMALKPGEEIGAESHATHDQFFRVEQGRGQVVIDGHLHKVKSGDCVLVPAGAFHNLINSGDKALKVYTIYGPPNHTDQLLQKKKATADAATEHFEGETTEQSALP